MTFATLGATVEEVDPGLGDQHDLFRVFWFVGAARLQEQMTSEQLALLDPGFREVGVEGAEIKKSIDVSSVIDCYQSEISIKETDQIQIILNIMAYLSKIAIFQECPSL